MNTTQITNGTVTIRFEFSGGAFGRCVARVGKHYTIMSRGVGLSTLGKLVSQGWVRV